MLLGEEQEDTGNGGTNSGVFIVDVTGLIRKPDTRGDDVWSDVPGLPDGLVGEQVPLRNAEEFTDVKLPS